MDKLNLSALLRYLVIGYVIGAVVYCCEGAWATRLYEDLGPTASTLAALAAGSLFYFVYRPLIYQPVLHKVVDRLVHTVRRELMERYTICRKRDADAVWNMLKLQPDNEGLFSSLEVPSSGIHLLYMTAAVNLAGVLYTLLRGALVAFYRIVSSTPVAPPAGPFALTAPFWVMLALALVCALGAIVNDIYVEKLCSIMLNVMLGRPDGRVSELVLRAGYQIRKR